jgi:hypothetical protein
MYRRLVASELGGNMETWQEEALRRTDEPLNEELKTYLVNSSLGQSLKHPLVFDVPHFTQLAWRSNDMLEYKRKALAKARKEKDWHTVIWLHERPYRVEALKQITSLISNREYWELLGMVFTDTENFWQHSRDWAELLSSARPHRYQFMTEEEQAEFAELPETLEIYRGFNGYGKKLSWSWTLDKNIAWFFAHRLSRLNGKPPTVATGTVSKQNVIGFLGRRSETEIVVNPKHVLVTKTEKGNV